MEEMIDYLKGTKKPRTTTVKDWIKCVRQINSYILNMEVHGVALAEIQLVKECIRKNIPNSWKEKFEAQSRKIKRTVKDVL